LIESGSIGLHIEKSDDKEGEEMKHLDEGEEVEE
jgi:hypothetical protein